jgi:hypothetical protein
MNYVQRLLFIWLAWFMVRSIHELDRFFNDGTAENPIIPRDKTFNFVLNSNRNINVIQSSLFAMSRPSQTSVTMSPPAHPVTPTCGALEPPTQPCYWTPKVGIMLEEAGWEDMSIIVNLKVRVSDTVECLKKMIAATTAASDDWKSIDLVYNGEMLDQGSFINALRRKVANLSRKLDSQSL